MADEQRNKDNQRQTGQDRTQHPQGGDREQKSETRRKAEEAARRDKPKGGASSVGTVGT